MDDRSKPAVTGSSHTLPFAKLSPVDFERLCLWLVTREGYSRAEHLGEAGSEGGRDVVAWKDGRRVVFQCKRVKAFAAAHARAEITKLRALPVEEQPHELVFVVSQAVSADTRSAARIAWGDEATCGFWSGGELDEKVKRHSDLLAEFFQLPPERRRAFVHNLPYASLGDLFQGRDEMLERLRESLASAPAGRATALAGKAVHGLGGVGKTRLAVEYAWQHAAEYSAVLFIGAQSPADLRRNLAALCDRSILDLPEQQATEEEVREVAALRWCRENPGWLLILDNVDSPDAAEAVDALIARLHGGNVLLTGRLARWGIEIEAIELDVLAEKAAADFLLARTEGRRRATKEDRALVSVIAQELGFLPLALEQAGAYIAERRLSLAAYLEEWQSRHDQVLARFDPRVSHYPASVAVTWQTSFDRLSTPARRLLQWLAWLGPEPIPESLLEVPLSGVAEPGLSMDYRDALVELETYSLVTRAAESPMLTVHRLVQDVTRYSLRNDPENESLIEALCWVGAAFVGDPMDVHARLTLDSLLPHARALVTFADSANLTDLTSRLINQMAHLLHGKALFAEAELLMRRALVIDKKNPLHYATDLNNLAQLLLATNRLTEAEFLTGFAISLFERLLGEHDPNVAMGLNNLAQVFKVTNRLREAEPLMRRALVIHEDSLGPEHPNVAQDLNNLAMLLLDTNRLDEAEPLIRRALALDEKTFGPEHPNVARDLTNLAAMLQATNRLGEAEPLFRQALSIDERILGSQHPRVANDLNNLAWLFKETDRFAEAEPLMRRALVIDEGCFGPEHPTVAIRLNNLALLLQSTNRLTEAEPLMRRALAINEKGFGPDHPKVAVCLNNLAQLLQVTNRLLEAEPLMERVVAILESSLGEHHPQVAIALNNLAGLLLVTNRLLEAEPLMRRHLVILLDFTRRTGHEHPGMQTGLDNYSGLMRMMGKSDAEIKVAIDVLVRPPE